MPKHNRFEIKIKLGYPVELIDDTTSKTLFWHATRLYKALHGRGDLMLWRRRSEDDVIVFVGAGCPVPTMQEILNEVSGDVEEYHLPGDEDGLKFPI
jgi:hypothetical protein